MPWIFCVEKNNNELEKFNIISEKVDNITAAGRQTD